MQGTNPITMQCTYSTPCGWCTKWDKECDKKLPKKYRDSIIIHNKDKDLDVKFKEPWRSNIP